MRKFALVLLVAALGISSIISGSTAAHALELGA